MPYRKLLDTPIEKAASANDLPPQTVKERYPARQGGVLVHILIKQAATVFALWLLDRKRFSINFITNIGGE